MHHLEKLILITNDGSIVGNLLMKSIQLGMVCHSTSYTHRDKLATAAVTPTGQDCRGRSNVYQ